MNWYLHYDVENIPAGFFQSNPDTPFIVISLEQKEAIERDPLSFRVVEGKLINVTVSEFNSRSFFLERIAQAPKVDSIALATDVNSILLAVTGLQTGKDFHIRSITECGEKLIPVNQEQGLCVMQKLHNWLANDNLKETR